MNCYYKTYKSIVNDLIEEAEENKKDVDIFSDPNVVSNLVISLRIAMQKYSEVFSHILSKMKIIMTYDLPTMAVDAKRNLYINPVFAVALCKGAIEFRRNEQNQIVNFKVHAENNPCLFVIAHEVYHIFNRTFERQKGRNHLICGQNLWNIATDLEMNYQLEHNWMLKAPRNVIVEYMDGTKSAPMNFLTPDSDGNFQDFITLRTINVAGKRAEIIYKELLAIAEEIIELQKKYPPMKPLPETVGKIIYKPGMRIFKDGTDPVEWYEVESVDKNNKPVLKKLPILPPHEITITTY